ncbi:peptidoglycan DD-metalloendopeptidase family protein [Jeotgalibaca sp. MA1X17-3]|uniref:murein hydrolase activator EnvC family protein n=1 Tax=Jeotgalibaca sp. MA1X17-3 TaxID=2908211 RepID=UPI001F3F1FEC|nr:M23 family metallopeptidase [Jeotgalibaca sp. MA1X17-3]UJF14637.1 peptidoglycan DD-metalloendopeptidase family protein [Jeotgalibaca sp. MA1X17-3]
MRKKYFALASTILLLSPLAGGVTAQADTLDELNQQKQQLETESQNVQSEINEKESSLQELASQKVVLQEKVEEMQNSINDLLIKLEKQEEKLLEIEAKIDELQKKIEALELVIEQRSEKLDNQARVIQTEASMTDMVSIVMSAENFSEVVGKITTVSKLVTANKEIIVQQENDKKEVEESKQAVEDEKTAAEELKQEIIIAKNNIIAQKAELDEQISLVIENANLTSSEKSKLESTKNSLDSQTQAVRNDISAEEERIEQERIAREKEEQERVAREAASAAAAAAAEEVANNLYASTNSTSREPVTNTGGFVRPASGYNSSSFGYRIHPIDGSYRLHTGMDIAGGGAILAAQSGTVEFAGYNSSYGYHVIINHGVINGVSVKTLYAHMISGLLVAPGQSVGQGQQIGTMGTTGSSTGVHLHFEVYENGVVVNPLNYISL